MASRGDTNISKDDSTPHAWSIQDTSSVKTAHLQELGGTSTEALKPVTFKERAEGSFANSVYKDTAGEKNQNLQMKPNRLSTSSVKGNVPYSGSDGLDSRREGEEFVESPHQHLNEVHDLLARYFVLKFLRNNLASLEVTNNPSYDWAEIAKFPEEEKKKLQREMELLADLRKKGVFTMNDWVEFLELPADERARQKWTQRQLAMKAANLVKEDKDWRTCVPPFWVIESVNTMVSKVEYEKVFGKGCCATMSLTDVHIYQMNVVTGVQKDVEMAGAILKNFGR